MTRRFVGGVLMALIGIALIVVPGVFGRFVGGQAVTIHVDPPPVVGDCVAPLHTPDELNSLVDVPVVSCDQPHSAEVLAVGRIDPADFPVRPTVSTKKFVAGELSQNCDQLAGQFLGWGTRSVVPRVQVSFYTRLTIPTDRQWLLGQRWYSCEVLPSVFDYPISYLGTAAKASTGTPPGAFANCADSPGSLPVSCDRPHHSEQLTRSFGRTGDADNCPALAATVMGAKDPTFGGQLAVLSRDEGGIRGCWVTTTGSQSLTATLINHGSGALPLR